MASPTHKALSETGQCGYGCRCYVTYTDAYMMHLIKSGERYQFYFGSTKLGIRLAKDGLRMCILDTQHSQRYSVPGIRTSDSLGSLC